MKSVAHPESKQHRPNELFYTDKPDETSREIELVQERSVKNSKKLNTETQNCLLPSITFQVLDVSSLNNQKYVTRTVDKPVIRTLNKIKLRPRGSIADLQKYSYTLYNANYLMSKCNLNSFKNIYEAYLKVLQRGLSYNKKNGNNCCQLLHLKAIFDVLLDLYNYYINKKYRDLNCIKTSNVQTEVKCGKKLQGIPHLTPTEKREFLFRLKLKNTEQKEEIFKQFVENIIPLYTGKSKSYKNLLNEICVNLGLLSKLKQKEKILQRFSDSRIPLRKGDTKLDINLLNEIRTNFCLSPYPETQFNRDKYIKATDTATLFLRDFNKYRIQLPTGLTRSQIYKLKMESPLLLKFVPSQTMLAANSTELPASLNGETQTSSSKEQILRDCGTSVNLLPKGTSKSEKDIIKISRTDFGLPPRPKSRVMNSKYEKAVAAGLIQPLEGKSPEQKVTILRGLHEIGIPLPVARTPSENILIKIIKGEPKKLFKLKDKCLSQKALVDAVSKDESPLRRRCQGKNRPVFESTELRSLIKLKPNNTNSFTQTSIESIKKDQHSEEKVPVQKGNIFRRFIKTVWLKNKTSLEEDPICSESSIISTKEHFEPPKFEHKLTQTDENMALVDKNTKIKKKSILKHRRESGTSLRKELSTLSRSKTLSKDSKGKVIAKNDPPEPSKSHKVTQVREIITPVHDNNNMEMPPRRRLSSRTNLSKKRPKKKKVKIVRWNPKTSVVTRASSEEEPILPFESPVGKMSRENLTKMISTDMNLAHEAGAPIMKSRPIVIGSSGEILSVQSILSLEEDDSLYIVRNMCGTHMFLNNGTSTYNQI